MKLLVSVTALLVLPLTAASSTPAAVPNNQVLRNPVSERSSHESVWTPEFPISTDVQATKPSYATIPLFGNISSPSLFNLYGELSIGTPPQKFKMVFETTASALWIPNFLTPASQHAFYDHTKSSSYEADGTGYISLEEFDSVYGFLSRDTVRVGDFTVPNMSLVEVKQVSVPRNFADLDFDGMFGLAPDLSHNVVLQWLLSSGAIGEPVFAFYLKNKNKNKKSKSVGGDDDPPSAAGELTIGAVDKRHYTGDIHYVDTLVDTAWVVNLDAVTTSSSSSSSSVSNDIVTVGKTSEALIMPSWPIILGPTEEIKKLAKAVGVKGITIDCSSEGPDIVMHIGGIEYTLTKDDYTLRVDNKSCNWAFMGMDLGEWWIGQSFLKKFYTVFEFADKHSNNKATTHRIGFALAT